MSKYLITGGAGFIGSTLANHLSSDHEVMVIDDLSMGDVSNLVDRVNLTFVEADVTNKELMSEVLENNEFDYIYHLAAIASVADSVERPIETHQINFESVLLLLELIKSKQPDLKRLVFSSSAAVYGDEPTLPKEEESVIRPLTAYAIDKFAAEKYVLAYSHLYNVPTSAVRFFNVYGPNQNPSSPYSGVISILVDRLERHLRGEEVDFTVFGDGSQSRDFVYVKDVIAALLLVGESKKSLGEVYNVGTGQATSLNRLIELAKTNVKSELPINYQEGRQGDIPHSYANISKLKALGFSGHYTIEEGLEEYLKNMFNQP
ncbi:NAD-dependent epimerase/dehydratase family protein [Vagococcus intermedius]|uniref:NAD-dependent epimerase/dehydratase family protein n=1 Tax=Vagococcus intermedius TaxID=2991418 RepID=A0AAF0I8B9_9ENTE|nr:NAD-dependent epimerase/dehydratase family protein [Vagococcus intermedius]WEG73786.1 NAD-dependent epimerase/dehydratase family protein [Vagococcus intermedius]WEG75871.1 NAD-dependent epimerase/dehydratase family protein [Vagococcus intermedius]